MELILSIVILAFNRKDEVVKTVRICLENEYLKNNSEIIVVDNFSSDGTYDELNTIYGEKITLLRTSNNVGISGWNKGFEVAKGKYVMVLDDDSHPESGVEEAVQYLDSNKNVGILALNVSTGRFSTGGIPHLFPWIGFTGCGAIIRKEVIDEIGGFSDWLFIYTHEFEYGIRVLQAGYTILFFKECHIVHRTSALNRTNKRLVMYSTRNELMIVDKYFPLSRKLNLLKAKLHCFRLVEQEGISSIPYIFEGYKKFSEDRKNIGSHFVSADVQHFFEKQFIKNKSVAWILFLGIPKWTLFGAINTVKRKLKQQDA
jgi:GT2 family glycosyltransferase